MKIRGLLLFLLAISVTRQLQGQQVAFTPLFNGQAVFNGPLEIQNAADGTNRLFVVEQPGTIKVFPNTIGVTATQIETFLDIQSRVFFRAGEEIGLLGLAFHPDFSNNRYFYVYYTDFIQEGNSQRPRIVVSRFTVDAVNPNRALPESELRILEITKNQLNTNHNGGKIAFGPDGYLYASVGDGGGGGDPQNNAQNPQSLFGKILRIDIDQKPGNEVVNNYAIPNDNPFATSAGTRKEIYALGIRNTWKFCFDPFTGRLWGADVGQNRFEEVNLIESGKNYGWSRYEANAIENNNLPEIPEAVFPIHFYDRSQGDVSVTGGYVCSGNDIPELFGKYVYGDFNSGRIWSLEIDENNPQPSSTVNTFLFQVPNGLVSSFGVDEQGELYFCQITGQLSRISPGSSPTTPLNIAAGVGGWSAMAEGINGQIFALTEDKQGNLYVGGSFTQAGNTAVNNIARWNPLNGWSAVGEGINGPVRALAIDSSGKVYAGGSFSRAGRVEANNIAVWQGSSWQALGTGTNGPVASLLSNNTDQVFAAGAFETAGGTNTNNIAEWKNNQWTALAAGTNNEIRSMAIGFNGSLYVGGNFSLAGNIAANRIASWNGANWGALKEGTSGFVQALVFIENDLYVAGSFANVGNTQVNRIARFNIINNTWSGLAEGLNNPVNALATDGKYVFAGGSFSGSSSNKRLRNIARWDPTQNIWQPLGIDTLVGGTKGIVNTLFFSKGSRERRLYVGGNINSASEISVRKIAEWQLPEVEASQLLENSSNELNFENVGVTIKNITSLQGGSRLTIQRFLSSPTARGNLSGRSDISTYRFVARLTDSLVTLSASITFNIGLLPFNGGIIDADQVKVYGRPTPGAGEFTLLPFSVVSENPFQITVPFTGSSEFIFTGIASSVTAINSIEAPLHLYPNPAQKYIYIYMGPGKQQLEITDILGRKVSTNVLQENNYLKIEVSDLTPGIYIVRAGEKKIRFVKQ